MADVAIIGAGVVGCAIARALALAGLSVVLIERGADILSGASKANSAILHTGFDAPPGSIEVQAMQAGYRAYLAIHESLNLPLLRTGAHVIAWTAEEAAKLDGILAKAHTNGAADASLIDAGELARREPALGPGAVGAVHIPGEFLIDPWSAPLAYLLQAMEHGAEVWRQAEVTAANFDGASWRLQTARGPLEARVVVNAAGLFGDHVEALARPAPFAIRPRRGQFLVYDKPAAALARSILLPVPTERTKGIVLCQTVYGNLLVGPTAEEVAQRDFAVTTEDQLHMLKDVAETRLPGLRDISVTATYAGLRPATDRTDYVLEALPERCWITACGIRSTGLTAALGIAEMVRDLYAAHFGALTPVAAPRPVFVPNLTESLPRGIDGAAPGPILCHCEGVTRAEVLAALTGPLPATDLGGLKRRTRVMMGRCQGFYCAANVAVVAPAFFPA
ncbi:NAD(P)/FAD-dependent oxidoreductase [Acidisoma cladoniae]|jgi:glycerol-3-phosphate dehydrogenase|uniref:NAD(P)/FAD-dependent oxidoreductase n=1 Tax=Acidisoma cladoniae TaxID=3040935 RepID=UPI002549FA2E|nr:NAD(P)/FAD-dependent oxidoreductase [Acidisoma sp. PAMC 29798]